MSGTQNNTQDQAAETTVRLLHNLFKENVLQDLGVRLWDGTRWPDDHPRPTTLLLNHPGALRSMFLPGTEVGLGEAYLYNDFDVEGNLEAVFSLADELAQDVNGVMQKLRAARDLMRLPTGPERQQSRRGPAALKGKRHSIERDRQAVTYHYDVSNDFYALFLDKNLVYSCAYFQTPDEALDTAQERKLDTICRKLRLRPGQRLLDIGCGWGGLVIHAAGHYGVDATGITLSQPQADLANERIAKAGLSDRCRVLVRDYREVNEAGAYDALASVGMFEHVGEKMLPTYFSHAWDLLKPGGVFLNHGITHRFDTPARNERSFLDAYVFPDGELTPISASLHAAEEAGFEVRDVESLREHYMLTLRQWVSRLEEHHEQALQYVDEPTYRVWRLFMSGSAYGFDVGRLNLHQALLVRPGKDGRSGIPLTRADWYANPPAVK
jgi:cyclopropane-fatty-acyl-phospholipid synthase